MLNQTTKAETLLELDGLTKWYESGIAGSLLGHRPVKAVDGVSLAIRKGEILGLVGESGCGKSTLGKAMLRLIEPTRGAIWFEGQDLVKLNRKRLRAVRRKITFVFQDPYSSLNPRKTIRQILAAPLKIHFPELSADERDERIEKALSRVGLLPTQADRYPHEFSGGQRQRVGIARALIVEPTLVVADEPVSALDVSIQAQIVNLMLDIRRDLDLSMVFIAHDLAVVGYVSDRIAVMYLGHIMEIAPSAELFRRPRHPYTEVLLSSVPEPDPGARQVRIPLLGAMPSPSNPPSGCVFRTRCRHALPACAEAAPLRDIGGDHFTACIRDDLYARSADETTSLAA